MKKTQLELNKEALKDEQCILKGLKRETAVTEKKLNILRASIKVTEEFIKRAEKRIKNSK